MAVNIILKLSSLLFGMYRSKILYYGVLIFLIGASCKRNSRKKETPDTSDRPETVTHSQVPSKLPDEEKESDGTTKGSTSGSDTDGSAESNTESEVPSKEVRPRDEKQRKAKTGTNSGGGAELMRKVVDGDTSDESGGTDIKDVTVTTNFSGFAGGDSTGGRYYETKEEIIEPRESRRSNTGQVSSYGSEGGDEKTSEQVSESGDGSSASDADDFKNRESSEGSGGEKKGSEEENEEKREHYHNAAVSIPSYDVANNVNFLGEKGEEEDGNNNEKDSAAYHSRQTDTMVTEIIHGTPSGTSMDGYNVLSAEYQFFLNDDKELIDQGKGDQLFKSITDRKPNGDIDLTISDELVKNGAVKLFIFYTGRAKPVANQDPVENDRSLSQYSASFSTDLGPVKTGTEVKQVKNENGDCFLVSDLVGLVIFGMREGLPGVEHYQPTSIFFEVEQKDVYKTHCYRLPEGYFRKVLEIYKDTQVQDKPPDPLVVLPKSAQKKRVHNGPRP